MPQLKNFIYELCGARSTCKAKIRLLQTFMGVLQKKNCMCMHCFQGNPTNYLTNRFHLFSNTSQIMSKCFKSKKVAHKAIAECVTDILTTFWMPSVIYYWTESRQHGIYLFYIIKKQTILQLYYFKIFQHYSKAGPFWWTWKKPFDVICCLYKIKQSHWLLCKAKNCDWSRKIMPLSNLTQMASGMWNENLQQK